MSAAPDEPADLPPLGKGVLFPNRYVWFVFLSAMDVLMTFVVLWFGGREANALANWILQNYGLPGMTAFKFAIVIFVIFLCEFLGRQRYSAGRRLAEWAIALTLLPVVIAFFLLIAHEMGWLPQSE